MGVRFSYQELAGGAQAVAAFDTLGGIMEMDRIYFHIIQGAAETMEVSAVNTVIKGDAGVGRANVIIGVLSARCKKYIYYI